MPCQVRARRRVHSTTYQGMNQDLHAVGLCSKHYNGHIVSTAQHQNWGSPFRSVIEHSSPVLVLSTRDDEIYCTPAQVQAQSHNPDEILSNKKNRKIKIYCVKIQVKEKTFGGVSLTDSRK